MCDKNIKFDNDNNEYILLCSETGYYYIEPEEYYWKYKCYHCKKQFCLNHLIDISGYDSNVVICKLCSNTICQKHRFIVCKENHKHSISCSYDLLYYDKNNNDFSKCIHCLQKV